MTTDTTHAGVTDAPTYRVYGYDTNAHWRNLVRDGRAVRLDSGADERGEYVKVKLVKAEAITVFGERR
jgi:hypothetical protein